MNDKSKAILHRIAEENGKLLARLAGTGPVCGICRRPLDDPRDPGTLDCGGDCRRCMAECGDPDCQATMDALGLPYDKIVP